MEVVKQRLEIPPQLAEYEVFCATLRGLTPLLMHNPQYLMDSPDNPKAGRKDEKLPPKEEAERGLYRSPDGWLYIGADHVREAILRGGKGLKDRKSKRSVYSLLSSSLSILENYFPVTRDGHLLTTYDRIDLRRAVVQKQGILRARPLIDVPWEVTVRYQLDVATCHPTFVVQALTEAGRRIGLLDYRPERGGIFGQFTVVDAWTEEL